MWYSAYLQSVIVVDCENKNEAPITAEFYFVNEWPVRIKKVTNKCSTDSEKNREIGEER